MTTQTSSEHAPAAAISTGSQPAAVLAVLRIVLGLVFLWAFVDKLFGLGLSTPSQKSWLHGGSPTAGYLGHLEGAASGFFAPMAGSPVVDLLFMLGLGALGVGLLLGIGLRTLAVAGTALMLLMWLSALPLSNNPVIDEHIVYAAALVVLAATNAGSVWGLGKQWNALLEAQSPALAKIFA